MMQFDKGQETNTANKLKDNMEINKTKVLEGHQNKKFKKRYINKEKMNYHLT